MEAPRDNGLKIVTLEDRELETGMGDGTLSPSISLGGTVLFRSKATGKVLLRKENLVLLRSRIFALESLFKLLLPGELAGDLVPGNLDRKVCLWKVGTGGTIPGSPFMPIVPQPTDKALASEVPFRVVKTGLGETLPIGDQDKYFGAVEEGTGEALLTKYYLKRINVGNASDSYMSVWYLNRSTNTAYIKTTLDFDASDARGEKVNELALYLGAETVVNGKPAFTNLEMATRLTFDTESLQGEKEVTIEYYVFV